MLYHYIARIVIIITLTVSSFAPLSALAQTVEYHRGRVIELGPKIELDADNHIYTQMVLVESRDGTVYEAENETGDLDIGDRVIMTVTDKSEFGPEYTGLYYDVYGRDRTLPLAILAGVFVLAVLSLGARQGIRALSALAGTMFVIFGIYTPMLLNGFSPITTSIILGLLIAGCAVFITHGIKRSTAIAYSSTLLSVVVALIAGISTIFAASLTGVVSDEVVYLSSSIGKNLDFVGIMVGGIIIAMLGVLDDIAITQVAVVEELKRSKPNATHAYLFRSALRVGRDHAGALVNTLVLVYVGTSLPLILLLQSLQSNLLVTISQEQFAFEIIRSLSGSIGLIACVPIATYLAIRFLPAHSHDTPVAGCPHCVGHVHDHSDH